MIQEHAGNPRVSKREEREERRERREKRERRERVCKSDDEVDDWDKRTKEMALSRYVSGYSYCLENFMRVNKKEKNKN